MATAVSNLFFSSKNVGYFGHKFYRISNLDICFHKRSIVAYFNINGDLNKVLVVLFEPFWKLKTYENGSF